MTAIRLIFILTFCASLSLADYLVITKGGKSTLASSLSKTADKKSYVYTDAKTRAKTTTPVDQMSNIIPLFKKGKTYPKGTAASVDASLKRALAAHPHLKKQIRSVSDAWKASLVVDPTMGPAIKKLVAAFNASDISPATYKSASYDLGMLQFKDGSGTFTDTIKTELDNMLKRFVSTHLKTLTTAAAKSDIALEEFNHLDFLAKEMIRRKPPEKEQIESLLETCRNTTLTANVPRSKQIFAKTKSIDSYLEARALLVGLQAIAKSSSASSTITRELASLVSATEGANAGYDLSVEGFPLTTKQLTTYTQYKGLINQMKYPSLPLDAQCLLLPKARPTHTFGKAARIQYTLVFNAPQPKGRNYHLIRYINGTDRSAKQIFDLGKLAVKKGQASITYADPFSDLKPDFSPRTNEEGDFNAIVLIPAYMKVSEEKQIAALAKASFVILK